MNSILFPEHIGGLKGTFAGVNPSPNPVKHVVNKDAGRGKRGAPGVKILHSAGEQRSKGESWGKEKGDLYQSVGKLAGEPRCSARASKGDVPGRNRPQGKKRPTEPEKQRRGRR